jgi:hypothetical protein
MELSKLQYPIGQAPSVKKPSDIQIEEWIATIEKFPILLREVTGKLSVNELDLKYRPNGWTIKQVVHHCADSHMNSFIRFKLTLTEDLPSIRPYYEDRWAALSDGNTSEIGDSLLLLEGLHSRWSKLLRNLTSDELQKEFTHPEHGTRLNLAENIGVYAWHSLHHLAHIKLALKK